MVLCACLAQVTVVLDTTIVSVALPDAQADLGFGDADRQWLVTAYTLAFGSLLLFGGRLSQFLGPRVAFMLGAAGFAVASLMGGLADSFGFLVAMRALQGAFAALLAPANLSLMNGAFPGSDGRARAFAIFGSVAGAGAALGLILGGVLTESWGWRWCLFVNVPIILVTLAIAIPALRSAARRVAGRLLDDGLGLVLGTGSVFAVVFGFSRAQELGWRHPVTVILLGGGVMMAVAFVLRERLAAAPLVPLSLLQDHRRSTSYLSIALVGVAQMGSSLYLTYYLQQDLGYSPLRSGVAFLPLVGALVVAAVLSTSIVVPRFGLVAAFIAGPILQGLGFLWMSRLGTADAYVGELLGPMLVIGLGFGMVMAPAMSSATYGVPPENRGLASALASTSQQLGASLGVAFLSTLAARVATERGAELKADLLATLTSGAAGPATSPAAIALRDKAVADATREAAVSGYAAGFLSLSFVRFGVAVLIAVMFAVAARRPAWVMAL